MIHCLEIVRQNEDESIKWDRKSITEANDLLQNLHSSLHSVFIWIYIYSSQIIAESNNGCHLLSHNGGPYYIETSPLICLVNQWTGGCMTGTSVMNQVKLI